MDEDTSFRQEAISSSTGIRIHVTGDAKNGFQHDFERVYDPKEDDRFPSIIELGDINISSLPITKAIDLEILGVHEETSLAYSALVDMSLAIPAPTPSLRSPNSTAKHSRVKIQNCQTWLSELVDSMIEKGVIGIEARHVVREAPQH